MPKSRNKRKSGKKRIPTTARKPKADVVPLPYPRVMARMFSPSFWRLKFPELIQGPLALGSASHFGLGLFKLTD